MDIENTNNDRRSVERITVSQEVDSLGGREVEGHSGG